MPSYNKENFKESNINYLNKDFSQLKGSLIDYAKTYFPNSYKDFNETSPGMMLIEMNAYIGDVLSFYIDQQYREMMLPLAEERRNIFNLAKMFGYKIKPIVPAYVNLTFTSEVNSNIGGDTSDPSTIDYTDAAVFDGGIKVTSTTNSDVVFTTLEPVDFTISSSGDTGTIQETDADSGLIQSYTLNRTVRAVSAEEKVKTFEIGIPKKFLKLTIQDKNVVDIVSVVDSNGNKWYEVDYLAQDKVPIATHYTQEDRENAYYSFDDNDAATEERREVAVPYSLQYIFTSKRFVRETNENNTTSLVFGNGILKNGTTIDGSFLDLEQVGVTIPGQANDLNSSINPLLGNEYSTLGETPTQTTLTVTYRVGGGIAANVTSNDLSSLGTTPVIGGNMLAEIDAVINFSPAVGGKNGEDDDEIREKTKAFFSTQNRCVTKEDYEARIMNISAKYGNIAKAYVTRESMDEGQYPILNLSSQVTEINANLNAVIGNVAAISENNISQAQLDALNSNLNGLSTAVSLLPGTDILNATPIGEIRIYVLAYDKNKNLYGNPASGAPGLEDAVDNIPIILKNNIANYIDNFRILTDTVQILDGFIINFAVFFDIVAHKYANKREVKLLCIQKIKDYFKIEKMQFNQPIYYNQLEYELMDIEGVRRVNYVTITQESDYNGDGGDIPPTYYYSVATAGDFIFDGAADDAVITFDGGTAGYGWNYSFEDACSNGVCLPPNPQTPGVFELKNPHQNIKGVVR